MSNFSLTLTQNGHLGEAHQIADQVLRPYVKRAGLVIVGGGMAETFPWHITGTLARSWAAGDKEGTGEPFWQGNALVILAGPHAIYARRVNYTSKKHKGYVERGFARGRAGAIAQLKQGISELGRALWVKGGR